jgi:hypothetical protein
VDVNPIEVQRHLKGVDYPAARDDVVSAARKNDAPDDIVSALEAMADEQFDGPDDVMRALG